MPDAVPRYWSFLSYSSTDAKVAERLHAALEAYRIPGALVGKPGRDGPIPRRLFPVFRDRDELALSADLGSSLRMALQASRFLIVLCSPHAARSKWVNEEVRYFKHLGRADRIIAIIVDGEPELSGQVGGPADGQCFPPALRLEVNSAGAITNKPTEPLAGDLRPGKDPWEAVVLKTVAAIAGLNYDDLRQRDVVRRRQQAGILAAGAAAILCCLFVFAGLALQQRYRVSQAKAELHKATQNLVENQQKRQKAEENVVRQTSRAVTAEQQRDAEAKLAASKAAEAQAAREAERWKGYVADVLQLEPAWRSGRQSQVAELLSRHRPPPGSTAPDLRGVEWYVWNQRLAENMRQLPAAKGRSAAFGPGGKLLATADETHASVWNIETGQQLWRRAIGRGRMSGQLDAQDAHSQFDHSIAFSPDGQMVAATSFFLTRDKRLGSLRVWNAASGEELRAFLDDDQLSGRAVTFSPDSQHVIGGGYGSTIKSWNVVSGREESRAVRDPFTPPPPAGVLRPGTPFSGRSVVWQLAFFGDDVLACVADDVGPTFHAWGESAPRPPRIRGFQLQNQFDFSYFVPGYSHELFMIGIDRIGNEPTLFQQAKGLGAEGRADATKLEGGWVTSVAINGHLIAAAGADRVVRVWNLANLGPPAEFRGSEEAAGLAWSSDGKSLAALSGPAPDHAGIQLWNVDRRSSSEFPDVILPRPNGAVDLRPIMAISPQGSHFAQLTHEGIRVVSAANGEFVEFARGLRTPGIVHFSPNERYLAFAVARANEEFTEVYDLREAHSVARLPYLVTPEGVAFSPDSTLLAGRGKVWAAATGALVLDCGGEVTPAVAFSPSGRYVAFSGQRTAVWDLAEKRKIHTFPKGGGSLAFQPDDSQLLAAGREICAWDLKTGSEIETSFGQASAFSAAISSDARRLYLLHNGGLGVYSNVSWNHMLTLPVNGWQGPQRARDWIPVLEQWIQSQAAAH